VKWITGDFVNTKADRGDICRMHSRGGNWGAPVYFNSN